MRVVARKGMKDVTVQDIADEAQIAKGTVYIYFQSREEILETAMDMATEKLLEKLASACQDCRGIRELLEQRVRTQLQHFDDNRDFFRMYHAMSEPFGERRLKQYPTYQRYLDQLRSVLQAAIGRREIRNTNVDRLAIAVSSIVRDIVLNRIIDRDPPPIDDDVKFTVDFVLRGIGNNRGEKS